MWVVAALVTTVRAQDLHNVVIVNWLSDPSPRRCRMAVYIDSDVPVTGGFYVDVFENRAIPPELGEWGDYYLYIDAAAQQVYFMDGRPIPLVFGGGNQVATYYLAGVAEVRIDPWHELFNVYLSAVDSGAQRWDVIVNGDALLAESDYTNNWADVFTTCR